MKKSLIVFSAMVFSVLSSAQVKETAPVPGKQTAPPPPAAPTVKPAIPANKPQQAPPKMIFPKRTVELVDLEDGVKEEIQDIKENIKDLRTDLREAESDEEKEDLKYEIELIDIRMNAAKEKAAFISELLSFKKSLDGTPKEELQKIDEEIAENAEFHMDMTDEITEIKTQQNDLLREIARVRKEAIEKKGAGQKADPAPVKEDAQKDPAAEK